MKYKIRKTPAPLVHCTRIISAGVNLKLHEGHFQGQPAIRAEASVKLKPERSLIPRKQSEWVSMLSYTPLYGACFFIAIFHSGSFPFFSFFFHFFALMAISNMLQC